MPSPTAEAAAQDSGTALVRHAPVLNAGTIEGSVHQLLGESATLKGNAAITGDFLVPGTPVIRLNGKPAYGGTIDGPGNPAPTNYQITVNGSARIGRVVRRTDPVPMPAISAPPAPAGTRAIRIDSPGEIAGDFATLHSLTLAGAAGRMAIPPGTYGDFVAAGRSGFVLGEPGTTQPAVYHFQRLVLDGQATLQLAGPVSITVAREFTVHGSAGAPEHGEWLTLNVHSGGVTVLGGASLWGVVNTPNGTVALNGNSRLTGGVACDRLILNGGLLRLVAPQVPNIAPVVELTAPPDGTIFTAPATIGLSALAADPDGTIARVEFHQGNVKIGEITGVPFEFTWTDVPPGSYSLTAIAFDNAGGAATSPPSRIRVDAAIPYFTGFEPADGFTIGPLAGQGGWAAGDGASVTEALSLSGTQSILVPGSEPRTEASLAFGTSGDEAVVFADIFSRPAAGGSPDTASVLQTGRARIACIRVDLLGEVFALNGGGNWLATGFKIALSNEGEALDWVRFTIREDFAAGTWDLYANGRLIAFDQGFAASAATSFSEFSLVGASTGSLAVDDFFVGFDNPLFTDADKDGMEDAWESAHGLDTAANDRDADRDADGLSNIREYQLGLRPDKGSTFEDGIPDALRVSLGLSLTGPTIDTIPPAAPADVTAVATGLNVALLWSAATDNVGVAGYIVSRDDEPLTAVAIGATIFADVVPKHGAFYTYAVRAVDFAGNQSLPGVVEIEVPAPDTDANGLPDDWEWFQFGSLGLDPEADPDGDGIPNVIEFENGTDPRDFFNGLTPILQSPHAGVPSAEGVLELLVLKPDGTPWANAPVTFEITSGYNRVSAAPDGSNYRSWVEVRSDEYGTARAYLEARP